MMEKKKIKDENIEKIRHSAAHVMADAVKKLYPGVKLGIGPAIEGGFYYDFDFSGCKNSSQDGPQSQFLSPEDLPKIAADHIVVLELSSFQLAATPAVHISPHVAVITNLAANHLDRHGTMAAYEEAKKNIDKALD